MSHEDNEAIRSTVDFLDICFAGIPVEKQKGILKRLKTADESEIEARLYELVCHQLLFSLGLSPELEPVLGNYRPDLRFNVFGTEFIAEVFVTHSPTKTLGEFSNPPRPGEAWDAGRPGQN